MNKRWAFHLLTGRRGRRHNLPPGSFSEDLHSRRGDRSGRFSCESQRLGLKRSDDRQGQVARMRRDAPMLCLVNCAGHAVRCAGATRDAPGGIGVVSRR